MKILVCLFWVCLIAAAPKAATFKIATEYPDGTAVLNELRAAGKLIESQTQGRVTFKFYPGGVMGDALAVKRKVRIGQLHGAFIHSGALAIEFPDSQVLNAPLLFRDFLEVDAVRAKFDAEFNQGFIDSGWQTFGLIEGGFAYAMTNTPAVSLAELRQQKLWLPANDPLSAKLAKAFDMKPISLNIGDVLTALQTGAINAIVAPPVGAITLQWHSQVQYLVDAPFMYTYGVIGLSKKAFARLTGDDKRIVSRILSEASQRLDRIGRADNIRAFDALSALGITILEVNEFNRIAIEKEALAGTQYLIETKEMSESKYQRVAQYLDQIRNAQ